MSDAVEVNEETATEVVNVDLSNTYGGVVAYIHGGKYYWELGDCFKSEPVEISARLYSALKEEFGKSR